ncbi:MAG: carboxypeptidase-like regulatory domain-containing protein [Chromatiales bacterium]
MKSHKYQWLRLNPSMISLLGMVLLLLLNGTAAAQSFAELQFDIIGVQLTVDPPALTVPKDIPTIVNTELTLPPGAGPEAQAALDRLRSETRIQAQLRGPSLPAIDIEVRPGDPIPIPPFALPGDYFLDQIQLVKNGEALLDATPGLVPIKVISEILVTSVTSRPLTLDEIREQGIVIDENNFDIREFQLALNVDGNTFKIRLPVALPTRELLAFQQTTPELIALLSRVNAELNGRQVVELPDDFDRPGLNFSIAAIPFMEAGAGDGDPRPFGAPPITGLVVIPGNIAFLNQFFSVMVTVANVAPDGSLLSVRDLTAEITLPAGEDLVSGSFEQPGDDPLRLARIEGIGVQPVIDIAQPGPDGELGTADDEGTIPPQNQGAGEFLVEGLREGFHTVNIALSGILEGLPSGPVEIQGAAIGAVLVRDPTFSITLVHPRTIRSGEPYDLYATITNTSTTVANLVTVNLDERGVSGAVLDPNTEPTIVIDTLLPGDSFTQKFTLIAQKTGQVTAASFNSEPGVTGRFQITTGVGERGIPLSPNAIVLPDTTRFLPDGLVSAALRVLGQAYSIATAPSGALPADVAFVRHQTVIDRGRELGEAGQRVAFGEPLTSVLQDLLLDWLGDRTLDNGFDQLLRQSNAGTALAAEFGALFEPGVTASSLLDFLDAFARQTVTRDGHLVAIAGLGNAPAPVKLRILDGAGNAAGSGPDGTDQTLPYAEVVPIITNGGRADFALVSRLDAVDYIVELTGTGSGLFDLGVSVPTGAGEATLLIYSGVAIGPGGTARITIRLGQANSFDLVVDSNGDGLADATVAAATTLINEVPPQVLAARQLESYNLGSPGNIFDPATYGLLVGVLFDKPVTETTATETANYVIESNSALGAVLQPSGRLAYLYLERPIGTLVDREITISGIADERGNLLIPDTRTIETVLADGAHVFGQLHTAAGEPVPDALLDLTIAISPFYVFDVSRIHTDSEGNFDFDFVRRIGRYFTLKAQHPETLDFTSLIAKVRAPGEEMLLFPTFRGKGSVRGQVTDAAGLPVAGAPVLLASPQMPRGGLGANADVLGEYIIPDVPVGTYTVRSFDGAGAFGLASGVVESAGEEAVTDIQLILQTTELGNLTGRVFLADGSTPGVGFSVYVGSYDRLTNTISAVDQTESDEAGSFAFENLIPGAYDVVAIDPTGAQLGVAGNVLVVAGITSSAVVVLEENGAVEGVVYNAQGFTVEGALVAGGISLGVTDPNGFFRIEGVPPGKRTIQAGNPLTKRRGSQSVTVLSNQTVNIAITLEARATIQGTVRDVNVNGNPVPRATVRIVRSGGFEFVFANDAGQFRFPDRPLGGYLLQAPGPGQQGLIEFMQKRGIPACSAFTAIPPDPPPDLNCQAQAANFSDNNAALAAYQNALETAFNISETLLSGPPAADLSHGFGWTKVDLFQDSATLFADIDYLPLGNVSGVTLAGNGLPAAASTRISALGVAENGAAQFKEHGRMDTDLDTGEFAYGGIALFDLDTFQNTGIRSGTFKLEAASTLESGRPTFTGELNVNTPNWDNIVLQFPLMAETSGTLSGSVFLPDGVTPAPANVDVTIDYGDGITVRTDPDGRFVSSFPIPKFVYTVTALDPISGLTGQARAAVLAGENTDIEIRLLGLGDTRVIVKRPDGSLVPDANVSLKRSGFPGDELDGVTNGAGEVQFFNVTEGKFGVMAEEQGTGLKGRASGAIARDGETTLVLTLHGAGTVTGTYLAADGITPVANANVTLNGGIQAYANTDADGRFFLDAIPVGRFTVEASDPLTGRLGRASGELFVQGDLVDITIIQFGRGSVEGFVTQADGVTPVAGAHVSLSGSGVAAVRLQSTTRTDGSFRFDGVTVGNFSLSAKDASTGFSGDADGSIGFEGDLVVQNIILEGLGAVQVQVLGTDGNPVDNVEVTLSGSDGSRTAAVDTNGEFTFEFLKLGNYRLQAHSLANEHNGGVGETTIGQVGETAAVILSLRGIGEVTVVVVDANGVPEPSARVNLEASARLPGETGRLPFSGSFTAFTDASGQVSFPGVPVGEFFVSAESGPVRGVSTGVLDTPDQSVPITVELGATGSVRGRMLLADGFTAAANTYVTLHFQPQSSLQSGILQITRT